MDRELRTELVSRLAAVRRRWLALAAMRTTAYALTAAAVPIVGAVLIDQVISLEGTALMLVAAVTPLGSIGLAGAAVGRMQRRPDDRHVARFIEERAATLPDVGSLDDAVVSAVEISSEPAEPARAAFIPLVVEAALRRLRVLDPARLIEPRALGGAALQSVGGATLLGAALLLAVPGLLRAIDTTRVRWFPETVEVQVLPGDTRLPAGSPLRIRALVRGGEHVLSRFPPSLIVAAGAEERTVRMMREGDGFEYAFESVDRTFTYRVSAGAARSSEYTVTALHPPRVRQIDLRYEYPSFTGITARDDEDSGDIYGPAGTRVRVRVHTAEPIAAGELALGDTAAAPLGLRTVGERVLEGDLLLEADNSYRVRLVDADGLRSDGHTEYYIRLMDDRPPDVRILRPSADQSITPLEEVTIEARADDDYGVARFELVFSVSGGRERAVPFERTSGTDVQTIGTKILAAEELDVKPGDVIAYYARAWDVGRGKRPTLAQSDIFFLEVKPFSGEFVLAESQAGGGGAAGAQIESLIAAQKEIISATWNLERRSQNGVSETDLKRVVEAQAELRKRTEALGARGGRGRIPREAPFERHAPQFQAAQRRGAADPVSTALEAMARAVKELEAKQTRDAIQHEMAALNGLLEVQAEVRRREVTRQAAGAGGGWGNRNEQDLSALFDRELQRQQRTTYENRSSIQQREQGQDRDERAADKIRDLARRQEELSRRQRELAGAKVTAEERKRQLERLTREQAELREQAEEMLRQAEDMLRQMQGTQGNDAQTAGGLRDASEQMRAAAGELRKEDAMSAAQGGERAAEQLRRLEQRMRGSGDGAQQRAAGELQVEARQIAQEQRRIAAEAERLDRAQGATADARNRLADEKERLAGRVDELQRAAAQQARRDGGSGASGTADAARELANQRLGEQMRDGAREMRAGAGQGTAPAEQQLARALEGVADRLGGNASAEARGLSEQLEQANQLRDRLNRLEEQMRDARARQQAAETQGQQGKPEPPSNQGRPPGPQGTGAEPGPRGAGATAGDPGTELEQLRAEYDRELQRAREALGRLQDGSPGASGATPEHHEFATSAPGTEQFKHDRSEWESLRRGIDTSIERQEAAISERLARTLTDDRLSAGGSERVPDRYQRLIARYYESLARLKK